MIKYKASEDNSSVVYWFNKIDVNIDHSRLQLVKVADVAYWTMDSQTKRSLTLLRRTPIS